MPENLAMTTACSTSPTSKRPVVARAALLFILFLTGLLTGCSQEHEESATGQGKSQEAQQAQEHASPAKSDNNMALTVQDISEREYGKVNALAIAFSTPIAPDQNFAHYIRVSPSLTEPVLGKDGRRLYYTGIEPDVAYTLNIDRGIKAANGKVLQQEFKKTITARAISPVVSFDSEGMVMVPGHTESLPVTAINVPEADLNLYRVKDNKVAQFFDDYGYYGNRYLEDYLEHQYSARIITGSEKNARNRVLVDLNKPGKLTEPGVYFVTLAKPGAFEFDAKTWFTVSAIGLQLRKYQDHTRVITQDITSGKLLSGVDIAVMDYQSKVWAEGETDKQGSWTFKPEQLKNSPRLIMARKGKQVTILRYHAPTFDLADFNVGGRPSRAEELLTWSSRDIYRPGENITLSTLKRNQDGQPVTGPVKIEIRKPDGSLYNHWLVEAKANGYHELAFTIPSNAPVGSWQAEVSSPGNNTVRTLFNFKVEEFLPERLRLTFNPGIPDTNDLTSITKGSDLNIKVLGEYLYGAPAADNRLDTSVRVKAWPSPFESLQGYIFGNPAMTALDNAELEAANLDNKGYTATRLPEEFNLSHWQVPAKISLQYSLYETGGRAINRFYDVLLWPKQTFVGIKPLFQNNRADNDTQAHFSLLRTDDKGAIVPEGEAKIELYREEEKYFWTYTKARGWHYERVENEYLAVSQDTHFTTREPVSLNLPVEWGRYRLEITDLQSSGKTVYPFFAGEDWYSAWNENKDHIRPDKVNLALNKKAYKAGDTAILRIAAPTEGMALVMLEADQVLYTRQVQLKEHQAEVEIPIPDSIERHDLYVSAFVVAPTENTEKVAKRSFGIIPLPLDRTDRKLDITIDAPEQWRPGQQVNTKIHLLDSKGSPVSGDAWVTLSAVDSGVLSITGYKIVNPYDYFYSQRKYSARLSDMFDDILEYKLADNAKLRWGGDADLTRGGDKPRTEVNIISLFSGLVQVTAGSADIPLDLPEFDGELKLTAVGFSGDQFGIDNQVVKVTSPVVAQLSAPRFLASGDRATLAIDLMNMSGKTRDVNIAINASGPLVIDARSKANSLANPMAKASKATFHLQQGQREVFYFNVKALEPAGPGRITATIALDNEILSKEWTLGVRNATPARYQSKSTILHKDETLTFSDTLISGLKPDSVNRQLRISNLPDLQAAENWRYLTDYPYTCLEQTISQSMPIAVLATADTVQMAGIEMDKEKINSRVQAALDRLSELQQVSGGFGLWLRSADEDHWLTAYGTELLFSLKKAGYNVPDLLLESAIKRLKYYVTQRSPLIVRHWSQSPSHYQLAYKAYAAYLLAKEGKITLGPVRDIAERELRESLSPLLGIHLGLAMINTGSKAEGEQLIADALKVKRKQGLYLGDYGSAIRDQALAISYLLEADILKKQALNQLVSLHTKLQQKKYLSPQERSALFRLAVAIEQRTESMQWQGELSVANEKQQLKETGTFIKNLKGIGTDKVISFTNHSTTPVFASFAATGIPASLPAEVDQGIKVHINHYQVKNGKAIEMGQLKQLNMGDIVLTRVKVMANQRIPDALLVSLVPAGLELENQNLDSALKLSDIRIDNEPVIQKASVEYQEYRDDRYVAALNLYKNSEQVLFFISRAVNPGEYQAPPAMVESMYTPEIHGISNASGKLKIAK